MPRWVSTLPNLECINIDQEMTDIEVEKSNKRNKIDNLYNKAMCNLFLQSWP